MLILVIVLSFITFIMILSIYVKIELEIKPSIQQLQIGFSLFKRLPIYRVRLPLEPKENGLFYIRDIKKRKEDFNTMVDTYPSTLSYIKSKITIEDLKVNINLGVEEGGRTALYCGVIINILDFFYRYLESRFKIKNYNRKVLPIFNKVTLDIELTCIMSVKTGYIIIMLFKFLYRNIVKAVKHRCRINVQ